MKLQRLATRPNVQSGAERELGGGHGHPRGVGTHVQIERRRRMLGEDIVLLQSTASAAHRTTPGRWRGAPPLPAGLWSPTCTGCTRAPRPVPEDGRPATGRAGASGSSSRFTGRSCGDLFADRTTSEQSAARETCHLGRRTPGTRRRARARMVRRNRGRPPRRRRRWSALAPVDPVVDQRVGAACPAGCRKWRQEARHPSQTITTQ